MSWNKAYIDEVALAGASSDYALFEAIGLSEIDDARVLDAGCFDGFNTQLKFAPFTNIAQVVGIDPCADAVERARAAVGDERFSWHVCALEDFEAEPESFDLVYFSHSLQHAQDKGAALRRAHALLKPGGFVAIKTVDDSCNVSFPDDEQLMERVYRLYEEQVLPFTEHTRHTDRRHGGKCPSQLVNAGFSDVRVRTVLADTAGLDAPAREALFERTTYFRAKVPDACGPQLQAEMAELLARWRELFAREDYYFAATTFLVLARKAPETPQETRYFGPLFGDAFPVEHPAEGSSEPASRIRLRPMVESDLGEVMRIEIASFPDPWVPLAYAMELRYNPSARYMVALDEGGELRAYLGCWAGGGYATIAHVAVDPQARRGGFGRALLEDACERSAQQGCHTMQLQVRRANEGARAFYRSCGFSEVGASKNYYTNPDDDAIIMIRPLNGAQDDAR